MNNGNGSRQIVRFGVFEADLEIGELRKNGAKVPLQSQPFQVCAILLKRSGELVTREELRQNVWPEGTFVDFDQAVNTAIKKIRIALGDEADNPRFIQTLPGRGYRFICPVLNGNGHLAEAEYPAAAATPSEVGQKTPEVPEKERKNRSILKWLLAGSAVSVVGLAAAAWYLRRPLPPPRISDSVQITHDGHAKDVVGTDGSRLYFSFWQQQGISQVGIAGGEIAPFPVPLPNPRLHDVAQDGTSFLVGSGENGQQSLWDLQVPGGTVRRIANGGMGWMGSAAWSPDGRSMVYSTPANDIFMVRRDGTDLRKLVAAEGHDREGVGVGGLAWSPDGAIIRFPKGERCWEVSSDGSGLHELLLGWHPSSRLACGRWTPDGKFFIFLEGNNKFSPGGKIWALDERRTWARQTASDPIQLTSGPIRWGIPFPGRDGKKIFASGFILRGEMVRYDPPTRDLKPWLGGISAEQLSYSPDGKSIVYVSYPEGILWRANRDGTNLIQLTAPPIYPMSPQWSPDGTQIVFTDADVFSFSHSVIYIVSSKGGGPRRLLPANNGEQGDPSWSADGQKIVFGDTRTFETLGLSVVDIASGQITALPGSKGIFNPKSSPNGRFLAGLVEGPPAGIRVFDFETQRWSAVLVTNMDALFHTWSRDSRFIYFLHKFGPDQGVFRIRSTGGQPERVADLRDMHRVFWFGLDPTDAPLLLRDVGSADIYALTLEEK